MYAVFHSNIYRNKYSHFLRLDFPRIPFAKEYSSFIALSEIGTTLVNLHLLKVKLDSPIRFDVQGSNIVEFVKWENERVFINKNQYFESIKENEWIFHIGGYQVLEKWLKSRKNRELRGEEIEQFIQIAEIIKRTIDLMRRIDEIPFLD